MNYNLNYLDNDYPIIAATEKELLSAVITIVKQSVTILELGMGATNNKQWSCISGTTTIAILSEL